VGDYYTEGESVAGRWFGNRASLLGLTTIVKQDEFLSLCDNLHPATGQLLTQRRKTVRRDIGDDGSEQEVANRRVFYDFTISPPKSVSIMAFIGEDDRILDAHTRAVDLAMTEMERFAGTRVRVGGQCGDRSTGNLVGAIFRHDTSRALDPHLHSHCIFFNATFDPDHVLNETIREALKAERLIKGNERTVVALEQVDLTSAQKRDARYVTPENVLVLNRDVFGFKKGQSGRALAVLPDGIIFGTDTKVKRISAKYLDHVTVCREKEMSLATGDRLGRRSNSP